MHPWLQSAIAGLLLAIPLRLQPKPPIPIERSLCGLGFRRRRH